VNDSARGATLPRFPSDLAELDVGRVLEVAGRVTRAGEAELELSDAFARCRVHLTRAHVAAPSEPKLGSWVRAHGELTRDSGGYCLTGSSLQSVTPGTLTADGQFSRFTKVGPLLHQRARAFRAARAFFERRGYLEVATPVRVAAPGTDVYLEPQPSGDRWLITSPEFHMKRLLVGGLPRIFEFASCTRRDEAGRWHQPEFTMLEWYRLYQTFEELMVETEELVLHVADALERGPTLRVNESQVQLDRGFERLTVAEAFRRYAGVSDVAALAQEDEDRYFQLMVDYVDPALSRIGRPVLLTHYPLSQAALSTPSLDYPGFAERFELFIGGVELCNGYGELTCASSQRERFDADVRRRYEKSLPFIPPDDGLVAALTEGLPPCAGNALGFERLLAVLLEQPLSRVIAFPERAEE
jgi:elongation factor P--(R)-beta-lysine ligase